MKFGTESEILEFKKTTGEIKEAVNSISAILNKHGKGELYFGIKDDGTVLGQEIGASTLRDVSKTVSENIKPQIYPTIDAVNIDDKYCIRVLFEGSDAPYFSFGKVFMRVADEDRQMTPADIEEYFRRKFSQTSNWDSSASDASIDDIDEGKLRAFIERANEVGRIDYPFSDTVDILKRLELLADGVPCNAAKYMFGKASNLEIQMAVFATEEKLTFNDIDRKSGSINELIQIGERYIRNMMRWRVVLDGSLQRKEIPEVPVDAIREALQNSYCHKDFRVPQINEIAIFSNRIEIYNPGTFPTGVTPDDYIHGVGNSIHRNRLLAKLMYYTKDIESFGTGLKRIADACDRAGVKYEFQMRKLGFCVVFYRMQAQASPEDANDQGIVSHSEFGEKFGEKFGENDTQQKIVKLMLDNPKISAQSIAAEIGITARAVEKGIQTLKSLGIVERIGAAKGGSWKIHQ